MTGHASGSIKVPDSASTVLALLFGVVSLLYATVGQAGGTAFLAVMAFSSFAAHEMRPTALLLNIVAATYSTWLFNRGKLVDWAKLRPLLLASLPTALVGGVIVLDERNQNGHAAPAQVSGMRPHLPRMLPDRGRVSVGAAYLVRRGLQKARCRASMMSRTSVRASE